MSSGTVWITGAAGLIGHELCRSAAAFAPQWRVVAVARESGLLRRSEWGRHAEARGHEIVALDLTDFSRVEQAFTRHPPDLVIHCAALSKSPACQADPRAARRINVEATRHLAMLAQDRAFVFFSTDLVFDGSKGGYEENDPPNPLSVYGETKAAAEEEVLRNPRHTIIRTSLNAGRTLRGGTAFNEEMRAAWQAGRNLTLFTDEFRCPIPAAETARAVWELARRNARGLYHLAGAERLSRWEIGQCLARQWPELNPRMTPESLRTYQGAPRAPDTSLNCAKAQALLSFPLPAFSAWQGARCAGEAWVRV